MRDSQKTSVVDHQSLAPLLTFDWRNLIVFFFLSFLSPLQIICCSVEWTGEIYDRAWSRDTTCQFAWNQFSSVQWTHTLRVRFQWNFLLTSRNNFFPIIVQQLSILFQLRSFLFIRLWLRLRESRSGWTKFHSSLTKQKKKKIDIILRSIEKDILEILRTIWRLTIQRIWFERRKILKLAHSYRSPSASTFKITLCGVEQHIRVCVFNNNSVRVDQCWTTTGKSP